MRFYRIEDKGSQQVFCGTLADAHRRAKDRLPGSGPVFDLFYVEIHEVEVPTDKRGVLTLLNDDPSTLDFKVLRRWDLSSRGGLHELQPGEE